MTTKQQLRKVLRASWDDQLALVSQVASQQRRGVSAEEQVRHAIEIVAEAIVRLERGDLEKAVQAVTKRYPTQQGEHDAD